MHQKKSTMWMCENCGYKLSADEFLDNIKGICYDCGKKLPNSDVTLCSDCRQVRRQRAITVGKSVGGAVVAVGAFLALVWASSNEDATFEKWLGNASDDELDDGYEERRQQWIKDGFGGSGEKTVEMKRIESEMSRRTEEKWKNDPRRNTDPGFRWTDANRWDKD